MRGQSTIERFESHYIPEPNIGCWLWTSSINENGYGRFTLFAPRRTVSAHRFAYEYYRGTIGDSLTIDHLCRTRSCVNPNHLEAVTMKENIHRGFGHCGNNARKTHCLNGHELKDPNLYYFKGGRICKACVIRRDKERVARRRSERASGGQAAA